MVACHGPVRVWTEWGSVTTEEYHGTLAAMDYYLCDAHRQERLQMNEEAGHKSVYLTLAKNQEMEPGTQCEGRIVNVRISVRKGAGP